MLIMKIIKQLIGYFFVPSTKDGSLVGYFLSSCCKLTCNLHLCSGFTLSKMSTSVYQKHRVMFCVIYISHIYFVSHICDTKRLFMSYVNFGPWLAMQPLQHALCLLWGIIVYQLKISAWTCPEDVCWSSLLFCKVLRIIYTLFIP